MPAFLMVGCWAAQGWKTRLFQWAVNKPGLSAYTEGCFWRNRGRALDRGWHLLNAGGAYLHVAFLPSWVAHDILFILECLALA